MMQHSRPILIALAICLPITTPAFAAETLGGLPDGYVIAWTVAGPYGADDAAPAALLEKPFPPETGGGPGYAALPLPVPERLPAPGALSLDGAKLKPGAYYLTAIVQSSKQQPARLEVGHAVGVRLWLNGAPTYSCTLARGFPPTRADAVDVTLKEGASSLLLKIVKGESAARFRVRLVDGKNKRMPDVTLKSDNEAVAFPVPKPFPIPKIDFAKLETVSLFDGKSFAGWNGSQSAFRLEDGAIVGGSLKEQVARNEFLTSAKEYADFELRLKFKLLGDPKRANAGIQIRSSRIPDHHEMIGYQADMGQNYWGCLYDESRRRRVLAASNRAELDKVLKIGEWNEYVMRCEGRRIQLWINGCQTIDYFESDPQIAQQGLIGLQIHGGPPSEAWYKDITIKAPAK